MKANGYTLEITRPDLEKFNFAQLLNMYDSLFEDTPTNITLTEEIARRQMISAILHNTKVKEKAGKNQKV